MNPIGAKLTVSIADGLTTQDTLTLILRTGVFLLGKGLVSFGADSR